MPCCIPSLFFASLAPSQFQDMEGDVFIVDDTLRLPKGIPAVSEDVDDVLTLVDADGASCQPN